jgi:hypothetical protein
LLDIGGPDDLRVPNVAIVGGERSFR